MIARVHTHQMKTPKKLILVALMLGITPLGYAKSESIWKVASSFSGVPSRVIYAIALQESQVMYTDGVARPYPWTININGETPRALRFETRQAAEAEVRKLVKSGVTNIDIGPMQINYRYHGHSVAQPEHLLDPRINLFVAAVILRELMQNNKGDLEKTVADYHSRTPTKGLPYAQSVFGKLGALSNGIKPTAIVGNRS